MKALFEPDLDTLADAEDTAEFRRAVAAVGDDHRLILMILIPRLAAMHERGDTAGALKLVADVRRIVVGVARPPH